MSGQDELSHPSFSSLLHPEVARMIAEVQKDPDGFERSFSQMATADGLWELIIAMSSEHDRALYTQETFRTAYRRCLQEGFSQGTKGCARDLVNCLKRWTFQPEKVDAPVDIWYGRLDTSVVHSPDFGTTLAKRPGRASLTIDPKEGGSILWTKARDILVRLKSHP